MCRIHPSPQIGFGGKTSLTNWGSVFACVGVVFNVLGKWYFDRDKVVGETEVQVGMVEVVLQGWEWFWREGLKGEGGFDRGFDPGIIKGTGCIIFGLRIGLRVRIRGWTGLCLCLGCIFGFNFRSV